MQTSTASQFETKMSYENLAPFEPLGRKEISLTRFRPASQLGTDKIDADLVKIDRVIDMNDQNLVRLKIKQGATVTVTFIFGAVDNRAARLRNRANAAHSNLKRAMASNGAKR